MPALANILDQMVVRQFYKQNAGFFLVVFFLAFGIQQPPSFILTPAFLLGIAASPIFVGVVLVVFGLYYLKCFHFMLKTLQAPQNQFLYTASLLPVKTQRLALARTFAGIFTPAIGYTCWLGLVSLAFGHVVPFLLILAYHTALLIFTVYYFQKFWRGAIQENTYSAFAFLRIKWPVSLWGIRYLLRQEKVMLVLTKAFACALLFAFNYMYPYPAYDLRPTQIGLLMAVTTNIMLVRQLYQFHEEDLFLVRNLPYSRLHRFIQVSILLGVLLLPEYYLLLRLTPALSIIWPIGQLLLFGLGLLLLFYTLLYVYPGNLEKYIRQAFFLFMGLLLLLLCYPPVWLVANVLVAVAYLIFYFRYYQSEQLVQD